MILAEHKNTVKALSQHLIKKTRFKENMLKWESGIKDNFLSDLKLYISSLFIGQNVV